MNISDKETLDDFSKKLDHLSNDLTKVLFIMQSDPKTNERGLVERVRLIEESLNELLNRENIYKAKATVFGLIGGAIITVIFWLTKIFVSKTL
tara:strand:- start:1139 stop:1417 length:279 start_codon:yes stop_codon:yes gene_type:complete